MDGFENSKILQRLALQRKRLSLITGMANLVLKLLFFLVTVILLKFTIKTI